MISLTSYLEYLASVYYQSNKEFCHVIKFMVMLVLTVCVIITVCTITF